MVLSTDRRQDTPIAGLSEPGLHLTCTSSGDAAAAEVRLRVYVVGETSLGRQLDFTLQVVNPDQLACDPAGVRDLVADAH